MISALRKFLRACKSFTKSGVWLVSVDQESSCTDVFRIGSTTVTFLRSNYSRTRDDMKSGLPEAGRKINGMHSGPKLFFQMKIKFGFHLEIKVLESGGIATESEVF